MNVTKQLYQWDTGQKLTECTGIYVDYLIGDEVYRVEITDGTCIIPDELLQTSGRYKVWECMADNTLREFAFKVLPRPIPPNYVYTPTERLTFEGLVQKVDDAIADMISSADSELVKTNSELAKTNSDLAKTNSDLAKTNLYLDALYKLNKGQTYDVLEQESEAYSVDVPSGSKYVGLDMVGGKSVAWNQLIEESSGSSRGVSYSFANGIWSFSGTPTDIFFHFGGSDYKANHVLLVDVTVVANPNNLNISVGVLNNTIDIVGGKLKRLQKIASTDGGYFGMTDFVAGETVMDGLQLKVNLFDLTQMFGSTIADYIYSLEQSQAGAGVAWFKKLFPNDYYEYCEPTIISSQTDRVEVVSADSTVTQQITTGFPVLNSAGSVYDYIDLNERKLHQRVGNAIFDGSESWRVNTTANAFYLEKANLPNKKQGSMLSAMSNRYSYDGTAGASSGTANCSFRFYNNSNPNINDEIYVNDTSLADVAALKASLAANPLSISYELEEEIVTDITIPTELSDWLTVEAGGSVTFHNTDEGKRLLIPNKLSFVRKLDEVSV